MPEKVNSIVVDNQKNNNQVKNEKALLIMQKTVFPVFVLIAVILISSPIYVLYKTAEIQNCIKPIAKTESPVLIEPIVNKLNSQLVLVAASYVTSAIGLVFLLIIWNRSLNYQVKKRVDELKKQHKDLKTALNSFENEKQRTAQHARELRKFQEAVEFASDHIVITDPDGIVLYANRAVQKITGYMRPEIIGKKAGTDELWGGQMDKKTYEVMWNTIKVEKKPYIGEIKNVRKNGEEYFAEVRIAPVLDEDKNVRFFVGIERDITKAKEIDRMKTEFISLASHQLRTPLASIRWLLEMLIDGDMGELNKEQYELALKIQKSNARMVDLVNGLLDISRIESGRIIIEPTPTNIKELIDGVLVDLKDKIEKGKVDLEVDIDKDLPVVNLDPGMIRNVYINLLSNAIKYSAVDVNSGDTDSQNKSKTGILNDKTSEKSSKIESSDSSDSPSKGKVTLKIYKNGQDIISEVQDFGVGIPEQEQQHVFEKFFRAKNVNKTEVTGTGLGLYLVKAIIDSAGGKIWFESAKNKGTTFWFSLPLIGMRAKEGDVHLSS